MRKGPDFKSTDIRYYVLPMLGTAIIALIGITLMILRTAR